MAIIPPGYAQVIIPHQNSALTRTAYTTFAVSNDTGDPDPDALAEAVQSAFAAYRARIDSNVQVGPTEVRVGQDGPDPLLGFASTALPGGRSGSSVTPALALLTRKRTSTGGRRGRGFMYIPWGLPEGNVNEAGVVDTAEVNGWNTALSNVLGSLATADCPAVLLHGEGLTAIPPPSPITQWTCEPVISNQVRRQTR